MSHPLVSRVGSLQPHRIEAPVAIAVPDELQGGFVLAAGISERDAHFVALVSVLVDQELGHHSRGATAAEGRSDPSYALGWVEKPGLVGTIQTAVIRLPSLKG